MNVLKSRYMLIIQCSEWKGLSFLKLLSFPVIVADITNFINCLSIKVVRQASGVPALRSKVQLVLVI